MMANGIMILARVSFVHQHLQLRQGVCTTSKTPKADEVADVPVKIVHIKDKRFSTSLAHMQITVTAL